MQDLKVTLVQANQKWEDKAANFENYERLLENVETDLILLPEMFQTGFTMNNETLGEDLDFSESIKWLKKMSLIYNAAIYTSLIIIENGKHYNKGVFVTPGGDVFSYNKRKTFTLAKEEQYYDRGDKEVIVEFKGWKFQLQICYDLRFPELVRNKILSDNAPAYDAILYVANWPEKRSTHWKSLLQARAIENQCYVIGVNRVGEDANGFLYSGDSSIINALGKVDSIPPKLETAETRILNADELISTRKTLPFLKDR
jgi:predicted amidohydrolase